VTATVKTVTIPVSVARKAAQALKDRLEASEAHIITHEIERVTGTDIERLSEGPHVMLSCGHYNIDWTNRRTPEIGDFVKCENFGCKPGMAGRPEVIAHVRGRGWGLWE
jgi:tRNA G37 N-methylase TrmD